MIAELAEISLGAWIFAALLTSLMGTMAATVLYIVITHFNRDHINKAQFLAAHRARRHPDAATCPICEGVTPNA